MTSGPVQAPSTPAHLRDALERSRDDVIEARLSPLADVLATVRERAMRRLEAKRRSLPKQVDRVLR